MISQTAEYALRVVVYLATLDGAAATSTQIAAATRIPKEYLLKVLRGLAKGGIVVSQRGVGGGTVLSRPPERMTVWDVVDVVDPLQRIRTCPLGLKTHGISLCPLHKRLDAAMESVEHAFRRTTVAEVMAEPSASVPLVDRGPSGAACPGPVVPRVQRRAKSDPSR